jgi:non-ribosomal peptide synthetase component F/acyl carrier protein
MIYTSGSTGKPKGVMITHGNVVNFIYGTRKAVMFEDGNRMLCITTISFDIFVLESLFPLLTGMTIVLATTADQKDPDALVQLINQAQVDFIQMTPSHIKLLLGSGQGTEALKNVKVLLLGGEALPGELVDELQEHYRGKVYNMYGPTETTVYSCMGESHAGERVTIGKPIANTIIRVLDKNGRLAPLGVPGELCIGGEGVSKGYWHKPELTDEKFIKDNWGNGRLYRTGDLAAWREDGELICFGRIDQQVKVRGHRIEPGEIEAQLNTYPAIARSAVDAKGQGSDKYLVAYYESAEEIEPAILRAHLSEALPAYMIPTSFMKLDKLPLTPNGKLDRKVLPDPHAQTGANYVPPADATEEKLVELWSEVLRIDRSLISVTKNFFELGGHSLRAIYLVNKIEQRFGVRVGIREVFENISVRKLAQMVSMQSREKTRKIPKAEKRKCYPASSAQERLFYQQLLHEDRVTNNLPMIVSIKGNWSVERLQHSLQSLVNIHESLRTSFMLNEDGVVQQVHEDVTISCEILDSQPLEQAFENFVRPFNLEACPLMRCGVLLGENEIYLLVDIHHIVCDAVSLDILMTDFKNIYKGNLPARPATTYVDYACWQRRQTNHLREQEQFWLQQLAGELPRIDLPVIRSRDTTDIHEGATEIMNIEGELYDQLKKYTAASHVSIFMFLLSAYYVLLAKLSGNTDIIIGTDAIGRSMPELRNVTGTFINVLPLRLQVQDDISFDELLQRVKNLVLSAFENQDYQYDQMCVLAGRKIVDVYFSDASLFENEVQLQDVEFLPIYLESASTTTRYELELRIDDRAEKVSVSFQYSTDLYDADTIKYFMAYYSNIIKSAVISQP